MLKRIGLFMASVVMILIVVPILVAQSSPGERRNLAGDSLATLDYAEVRFPNIEQEIELAGLLFVPEGEGPFPGVVIIHGSGTSKRDNPWYLSLAAFLQDAGIVVLLPDKRGSAGSGGDWRTSSLEDLATDTTAAIDFLGKQNNIEVSQIGIVGMSQGGQIAPIVALQSAEVDFVINVVGSSLPIYEVLLYEESNNLREIGFLPIVSDLIAYPATFFLREYTQKEFWDAVGNFDPLPYWQAVEIPTIVLYGSTDTNVPSQASKTRLEELGKENIEVLIFEGSGHSLADPPGIGSNIFREDALTEIVVFIIANAR